MRNIRLIAILFFTVLLFQQVPSSYALEGNWGPLESLSEGQAVATTIIGEIEPQWGTASPVVHTMPAWQFMPKDQFAVSRIGATSAYRRACSTGGCLLEAPVMLPNGALIGAIQAEACDTDAANYFGAALYYTLVNSDSWVVPPGGVVLSEVAGTPGCTVFTSFLDPPLPVLNLFATYMVEVYLGGGPNVSFRAVRIAYALTVSPAPATATFNDVPTTHPFFQYIEALVASGITAGCGGGSYCPDAPLTRGQMAVFLSRALGLHWPY